MMARSSLSKSWPVVIRVTFGSRRRGEPGRGEFRLRLGEVEHGAVVGGCLWPGTPGRNHAVAGTPRGGRQRDDQFPIDASSKARRTWTSLNGGFVVLKP